ncbi:uncharacterized protein DSM5745_00758 [Aspergillus mulundensis]|uniref:Uncharacterized protein n=1 Tax=Aspergillus mulundensis TaxID=1810919 RepID=A0A3D8T4F2_9EURO|nr:hypothetical protein DSM5745_00758 [Aspergillus mulundensis]RDW93436.1 hypothetical protein DSM5745_00758 [Aspergillus mulundensis]
METNGKSSLADCYDAMDNRTDKSPATPASNKRPSGSSFSVSSKKRLTEEYYDHSDTEALTHTSSSLFDNIKSSRHASDEDSGVEETFYEDISDKDSSSESDALAWLFEDHSPFKDKRGDHDDSTPSTISTPGGGVDLDSYAPTISDSKWFYPSSKQSSSAEFASSYFAVWRRPSAASTIKSISPDPGPGRVYEPR